MTRATLDSLREALTTATEALEAMDADDVAGSWLEIVRLQEAIDTAAMLHAPDAHPRW